MGKFCDAPTPSPLICKRKTRRIPCCVHRRRRVTIYLTINTIEVPLHIVPDVADNSSLRQAEARILASGFKLAEIQYIPGEKDWVYGVKYKGRQLSIGEKVPTGAVLTLMVGDGGALKADSLGVDAVGGTVEPVLSEDSAADESWF